MFLAGDDVMERCVRREFATSLGFSLVVDFVSGSCGGEGEVLFRFILPYLKY